MTGIAPFPPRLHALLAAEAPLGVVFRRGPSKQVATFLWDRRTDRFTLGQWLKGRLYERRADLSPDGRHLLYLAMRGDRWRSETRGSWTAVSRAPFLKALDLYAKGGTWNGGGLFTSNRAYWLNEPHLGPSDVLRRGSGLDADRGAGPKERFGAECTGVYYPRLLRDGWTLTEQASRSRWHAVRVFEKPLPGGWLLRKTAHGQVGSAPGKGCYWDEHAVEHPGRGERIACPDWEWAERDGNTLVWARSGALFRTRLRVAADLERATCLRDFAADRLEQVVAPY